MREVICDWLISSPRLLLKQSWRAEKERDRHTHTHIHRGKINEKDLIFKIPTQDMAKGLLSRAK